MSLSLEKIGGTTPNNGYSLTCVKVSAEPVFGVLGDAWSTMVRTGGSSAKTWWNYSHWFHGRWKFGTSRVGDPKNRSVRWWNAGTSTFPHWGRAMNAVALGIAAACGSEFWFVGKDSTDLCHVKRDPWDFPRHFVSNKWFMFLWDRGVARNPWLLVPDPENCSARLLVAPNALEFSFPLCPVASNGSCCPQHFHSRAPNVHPSVRPSISVHPSLYNGKDLHAQQVTLIIAVGIATYCQHIATHSESPRFFPLNPGIQE